MTPPMLRRLLALPYVGGTAAGSLGRAVAMACQVANLWLLLQILDKAEFGTYVFVMAAVVWLFVFGCGGLDRLVLYRLSRDPAPTGELVGGGLVASALLGTLAISTLLALALVGLDLAVGHRLAMPGLTLWLLVLPPAILLGCVGRVFEAWYWARGRVAVALLVPVLADVARVAGFALALWLLPTPLGVGLAVLASFLLPLAAWAVLAPLRRIRAPRRLAREDLRYGAQIMLARGAQEGVGQLDILLLGVMAGAAATADYALAARIAVLVGLGRMLLVPVLTPRLGRYSAAGAMDRLELEFAQTRLVGLLGALLAAAALALAGPPLLLLLGDFAGTFPLLLMLSAAAVIDSAFGSNAAYLAIAGHAGWSLVTRLALLALLVLLNLLLIPRFGASGAAAALAAGMLAFNALMAVLIWRFDRVRTVTPGALLTGGPGSLLLLGGAAGTLNNVAVAGGLVLAAAILLLAERRLWLPIAARLFTAQPRRAG